MKYLVFLFALIIAAFEVPEFNIHSPGAVLPTSFGPFNLNSAGSYPGFGNGFTGSASSPGG